MFNICSNCLLIYEHSFASNSLNNSQDVRKTFSRSPRVGVRLRSRLLRARNCGFSFLNSIFRRWHQSNSTNMRLSDWATHQVQIPDRERLR